MLSIITVFAVFTVIVPCLSSPQNEEDSSRIVKGSTAKPGQIPYQAQIRSNRSRGSTICGGSLLNNQWVITAAHCIKGEVFTISLGALNRSGPEPGRITLESSITIVHNFTNRLNDIALIKLPKNVTFNEQIQPVSLPPESTEMYEDESAIVSGWGRTETDGPLAKKLQFAQLEVISNKQCSETYGPLEPTIICAKGAKRESACRGDSGGPLVLKNTNILIGIVSYVVAKGCHLGYPISFTRVSMYLEWISQNTGISIK